MVHVVQSAAVEEPFSSANCRCGIKTGVRFSWLYFFVQGRRTAAIVAVLNRASHDPFPAAFSADLDGCIAQARVMWRSIPTR